MGRVRTPAIRLDLGKVRETKLAYRPDGKSVPGVREVVLLDGRSMYRCKDCLYLWSSTSPAARHRSIDEPHVAGGSMPPISDEPLPEVDMYASSATSDAATPGADLVPVTSATPAQQARRRRDADPEAFLDANASDVAVSVTEFLDTLIASRAAARAEATEQRERADQAIRSAGDMRKVLEQVQSMIDRVLRPTEQDSK